MYQCAKCGTRLANFMMYGNHACSDQQDPTDAYLYEQAVLIGKNLEGGPTAPLVEKPQPEAKALKNDNKKADLSLVPQVFLNEVAKAFQVGEKKYGRYNYCKGMEATRILSAAMRHITAFNDGEDHDPEDGQHHLGAAGACIAMLLRQIQLGTAIDNRYKGDKNDPK